MKALQAEFDFFSTNQKSYSIPEHMPKKIFEVCLPAHHTIDLHTQLDVTEHAAATIYLFSSSDDDTVEYETTKVAMSSIVDKEGPSSASMLWRGSFEHDMNLVLVVFAHHIKLTVPEKSMQIGFRIYGPGYTTSDQLPDTCEAPITIPADPKT